MGAVGVADDHDDNVGDHGVTMTMTTMAITTMIMVGAGGMSGGWSGLMLTELEDSPRP
jgi:hypothetical protein